MTEEEKNKILDAVNNLDKTPKRKEIGVYAFVRYGKWIKENIVLTSLPPQYRWHCSECGSIIVGHDESVLTPYCSNCGAKMEVEE